MHRTFASSKVVDLQKLFHEINRKHFGDILPLPKVSWNSRLRSTAGRFRPAKRRFRRIPEEALIEIAAYLLEEEKGEELIRDTLAHEMIHFWLWVLKKPYGHTKEFHEKRREMGVGMYNPVPKRRPVKYRYQCPSCKREYPARRRLAQHACRKCCHEHNGGRFHHKFRLKLLE